VPSGVFLDDIPLSALLIAFIILLVISAFFSISETSMMALNRYRLKHMVYKGHAGAKRTARLLEKTDKLLGVILLGNNLVNAAAATLVTVIAVRLLGNNEIALTSATLTVTFTILVFSEITPKVIGATYPERTALAVSHVLAPMLRLAYPVVWFVNLFVSVLLWATRLKQKNTGHAPRLSMEELRTLVLETSRYLPPKHHNILLNLFELEKITVNDVMIPRNQIEAVDVNAPAEEVQQQLATCYHTRLPVYEGQLDNIVGVVHVRKVLRLTQAGELSGEVLRDILREPYFIPSGAALFTQLQNFQENHRRQGLVVDEYGELMGLITLEDILEEIVGEFATHSPAHGAAYRMQADGSWLVDGTSLLRDINRKLKLDFSTSGPKTLNGLILEYLEDIPEGGTSLKIDNILLEIIQTQNRVIKVVRIFPVAGTHS